jgi:LacI family transcriptional regulator/LacI family repressor for deo operon, udp, cdd, tsx, nupC, and nupG
MVSIKDIARAAQVSHSTVSRALRNSPLVSAETSALILKIARERGYTVSSVARSLVTKRTNTIGVVVTTIADPFAGEVVGGIEESAGDHGYSVILATCHGDPALELRAVQSFLERRVDGVLVMASSVGSRYLPMLADMNEPIVLINSHEPGEFTYSVRIDDFHGAQTAVRHLIELGHRRIAYIGDRFGLQSNVERLAGYRATLKAAALSAAPELWIDGESGPEGGGKAMSLLMELPQRPTAVFCYNDRQALGALRSAREHGLRVPADVSIVGYDDLFLASYTDPPLTTIQQPKHEMGRNAMEILLELLSGGTPQSKTSRGTLIVRQSTAPLQFG